MHAASAAPADRASALPRAAARHDLTVVASGGGTTLAWGAPPRRCDLVVDTLLLDQVHAAGGLGQVWRG
jgi:glycolate oxidase FAD binding subunit